MVFRNVLIFIRLLVVLTFVDFFFFFFCTPTHIVFFKGFYRIVTWRKWHEWHIGTSTNRHYETDSLHTSTALIVVFFVVGPRTIQFCLLAWLYLTEMVLRLHRRYPSGVCYCSINFACLLLLVSEET